LTKDQKDTARFFVEQGLKVGLVLFSVKLGADIINRAIHGEPGRTDRVPFNMEKTQQRQFAIGPNQFEIIDDPWSPESLANQIHTAIKQAGTSNADTYGALMQKIGQLGFDRAR
jgi:hypothetical protein